jgi:hypothetical protein
VLSVTPAPITVANNQVYSAIIGVSDTFIIDASQSISATINGFENGDILRYINNGDNGLGGVDNSELGDGLAVLLVGSSSISLAGLSSDLFGDELSFKSIFGEAAITFVL